MASSTAVGPLPVLSDPPTWAPAWEREEARMGEADALARATFRGIDSVRPANPVAKHNAAMSHALVTSLDDRASSITVVRRSREVGYRRSHVGFMDDAPGDSPWAPSFAYILTSLPFIGASDKEDPTTVQSTTADNHHRGGLTGHLVARHRAEYLSCATATRSRLHLSTPAWCYGVEVPYGSMAELPWVPADTTDDLHTGRHTPWSILHIEWARLEAPLNKARMKHDGREGTTPRGCSSSECRRCRCVDGAGRHVSDQKTPRRSLAYPSREHPLHPEPNPDPTSRSAS